MEYDASNYKYFNDNSKILNERELCIKGTEYLKNLILNKILKVKINIFVCMPIMKKTMIIKII